MGNSLKKSTNENTCIVCEHVEVSETINWDRKISKKIQLVEGRINELEAFRAELYKLHYTDYFLDISNNSHEYLRQRDLDSLLTHLSVSQQCIVHDFLNKRVSVIAIIDFLQCRGFSKGEAWTLFRFLREQHKHLDRN